MPHVYSHGNIINRGTRNIDRNLTPIVRHPHYYTHSLQLERNSERNACHHSEYTDLTRRRHQ